MPNTRVAAALRLDPKPHIDRITKTGLCHSGGDMRATRVPQRSKLMVSLFRQDKREVIDYSPYYGMVNQQNLTAVLAFWNKNVGRLDVVRELPSVRNTEKAMHESYH